MWARKYVGWNMAEQDDLVQEGMIAVWVALEGGHNPSKQVVQGRMMDYIRALGRQLGQRYDMSHVPIDLIGNPYESGEDSDAFTLLEEGEPVLVGTNRRRSTMSTAAYEDWFLNQFPE